MSALLKDRSTWSRIIGLGLITTSLIVLGGCVGAAIGAGSAVVKTATETRSTGATVDDTTIKVALNAKLVSNSLSLFRKVDTTVTEGRVLLTGSVPKPEQRIEAERLAWSVSGVREVNNELQVEDRSGILDGLRDTRICAVIRTKLTIASDIHSQNYSVECVNQQIYVSGIAADQDELDRVRTIVRGVESVKDVTFFTRFKDDAR
jgi:osmotically-inducible protein OsmY